MTELAFFRFLEQPKFKEISYKNSLGSISEHFSIIWDLKKNVLIIYILVETFHKETVFFIKRFRLMKLLFPLLLITCLLVWPISWLLIKHRVGRRNVWVRRGGTKIFSLRRLLNSCGALTPSSRAAGWTCRCGAADIKRKIVAIREASKWQLL